VKRHRAEPWRVLAWRNGEPVQLEQPNGESEFDEVVVGDWLHVESLDNEGRYYAMVGDWRLEIQRGRVTYILWEGDGPVPDGVVELR
jgi:hypothetical protein